MTTHSVMAIPMGGACMLAPAALIASYGVTVSAMGLVIYQFWGAALLGLGMLTWVLRAADANDFGWSTVALFAILALAFAYIRIVKLPKEDAA